MSSEANSSLRGKNILLAGPFSSTFQGLIKKFTSLGADCIHWDEDSSSSKKFCQMITDERERNEKFGRAQSLSLAFENSDQIRDGLGQCAQTFGGVDVLIDGLFVNESFSLKADQSRCDVDFLFRKNLRRSLLLTEEVIPYLKSRRKGRVIYLANEVDISGPSENLFNGVFRSGLVGWVKGLGKQLLLDQVTVNLAALALTEEQLLGWHPGLSIKEALLRVQEKNPQQRITEPERTGEFLSFLISPQAASLTGQVFHLT